jgi:4-hydroxy-2-oxoheptanedioate aldolase
MELPRNDFKHAIAAGQRQIGLWSTLASNIAVEVVADSGFDWILLDTEHAPNELPGLLSQLQALRGGTATAVVRPAWNDPVLFKRILDIGAQTLLVPYVESADEARRAVAATRYPPAGVRGVTASGRASRYGRVRDYLREADREIAVLVQVETGNGLRELDAIAAVEGVDGVFVGPADLAASLGHAGSPGHPDVQAAIKNAVGRLQPVGMPAGILTTDADEARRYLDWGFTFVAVGVDLLLLRRAADSLVGIHRVGPSG